MNFPEKPKLVEKIIPLEDFFDWTCPFCSSDDIIRKTTHQRTIPDLGTPLEKILVTIPVITFLCKHCGMVFTPEHPNFLPKYEYSLAVINYVLLRYNYRNCSGNIIADDLGLLHNVMVPRDTVYSWIEQFSEEFIKQKLIADPSQVPSTVESVTLDGTFTTAGQDLIGKKKFVESLSVTRLPDGRYLLMWWEKNV